MERVVYRQEMKRKIGIFLDAKPVQGGAYQFNLSMVKAVASIGEKHFQVVAAYTDRLWEARLKALQIDRLFLPLGIWGPIACRRISGILPMGWWRALSPLFHGPIRKIIAQRCDLWVFPSQDTWTFLIPVPTLGAIYDLMHRYERRFPEVSAGGKYGSRERHYKRMCRWANGILVDSEIGKHHLMESYGVDPGRIHVLHFVAPEYIGVKTSSKGFERRYQLPRKYLFYPAQFWEHKNHKGLIQAMALLENKIPDLNLVFTGSRKTGYGSVRRLVTELELDHRIYFLNYVPDSHMPELYRRARAMIMPTFFGPTNIPPLEAAAAGCPMAISGIYGMKEQMGDASLYFDPSSIREIALCMERLWTDDGLCRELSLRGQLRSKHWTQSHLNRSLINIIEAILTD